MREGRHLSMTHKIMAIGLVGLAGLLAFGAIYQVGNWSAEASRGIAGNARAISDLNKQLSIDMLEARRNEKNFQQRRDESYAKRHAEQVATIDADFDRLLTLTQSGGMSDLSDKVRLPHDRFKNYATHFASLLTTEINLGFNEQ